MADKASGGISVKVLKDESKVRFKGELNYETADSSEKWVYKVDSVPTSPAVILSTSDEFYGQTATDALSGSDKVLWIAVKHSGTSDGTNATTLGVMINFSGTNPLHGGTNDAQTNNMLIGPNELFVFRPNGTLVEDIKVGTVKLTGNKATGIGTGTVEIYVSAIIDDVS